MDLCGGDVRPPSGRRGILLHGLDRTPPHRPDVPEGAGVSAQGADENEPEPEHIRIWVTHMNTELLETHRGISSTGPVLPPPSGHRDEHVGRGT